MKFHHKIALFIQLLQITKNNKAEHPKDVLLLICNKRKSRYSNFFFDGITIKSFK